MNQAMINGKSEFSIERKNKMNAKAARKLTNKTKKTAKVDTKILNKIKEAATLGREFIILNDLSDENANGLESVGYNVEFFLGSYAAPLPQYMISW